jgi:DNA mismatch repair protein MutS2
MTSSDTELLPMRNRGGTVREDDEEAAPLTRARRAAVAAPKRDDNASPTQILFGPPCATCNDGAFPLDPPSAASRCRPGVGWAVLFLMLVLAPITEHGWHVLPGWAWTVAALAAAAELARRILTFQRWGDEYPYVPRFCAWFALMIAELLFENFMVWIVSATDKRKYEDVPALQDNVAELLDGLKDGSPSFWHPLLEFRWAGTVHFLCAALALAFSVAWDQVPYSGFGMMSRFFATTVLGRLVRVAAFCATVLPNPRPGCYKRRFPPPPETWQELVREGFNQLRGAGGCNDLVISGHGAFWTTAPLMFATYYKSGGGGGAGSAAAARRRGNSSGGSSGGGSSTARLHPERWMSTAVQAVLWTCLVQTALRDALEAFHYSVDMLLAVVVTSAAWEWTRRVYPPDGAAPRGGLLRERAPGSPPDAFLWAVLAPIGVSLLAGAVIIFIGNA